MILCYKFICQKIIWFSTQTQTSVVKLSIEVVMSVKIESGGFLIANPEIICAENFI